MTKAVSEVEKKSQDSKSLQTPKEALYVTKDKCSTWDERVDREVVLEYCNEGKL